MRFITLAALTVTLGGCAASPQLQTNFASDGQAQLAGNAPEDLRLVAVIDMQPTPPTASVDAAETCERDYMTGSRIMRTRCEPEMTQAMQDLEDHRIQWEIQYVRDLAVLEEQMAIEDELMYRREMARQRQ